MRQWVVNFLSRHTPSCKEMVRLISDSMEKQPSIRLRIKMALHYLICKWCRRYKKQLFFIRKMLKLHPGKIEEDVSIVLSPEARKRLNWSLNPKNP